MRTPYALRRYLLDSRPVTWWDLDPVNESEVMSEIDALEVGESITLGMCSDVERLPDAPFGYVLGPVFHRPPAQYRYYNYATRTTRESPPGMTSPVMRHDVARIVCVGPDDVGAATGLEVPAGIGLDERAQIHAATSLDELRALPFVVG